MKRNDGSIELEIMDLAKKYKKLTSTDLIKIYKAHRIDPNKLLDQFMLNVVYEDVTEDGNHLVVHKIRHVSDMIICTTLLNTLLTNNKDLRYTYSEVYDDGNVITVIAVDPEENENEAVKIQNIRKSYYFIKMRKRNCQMKRKS